MCKKHTYEFVKETIELIDGCLLSKEYINTCSKLNVRCNKCDNVWHPTFGSILSGTGCPKCSVLKYTYNFIKEFIENKDGCLLSIEYKNHHRLLNVRCNKCRYEWQTTASRLVNGAWCKKCSINKQKHSFDFISKNVTDRGFILLSTEYKNNETKLDIKCRKCSYVWHPSYNQIQSGSGCPKCSKKLKYTFAFVKQIIKEKMALY